MPARNFLLITTDQQRWDALGIYNSRIRTPRLDRLAAEGIAFDRAYTTNPVCTPSRCSILTGHYPSRHGCYTIGTNLPEDYPTLAAHFSRSGYSTSLIGKAHFQSCLDPASFESIPRIMDREFYRNWDGPYFGFDHAELVIGHSVEKHCSGMHYGRWLIEHGVDPDQYFGRNKYTDFGVWDIPERYHPSVWTADRTIAAIDRAAASGKPFLLWSSFQDPHNPCMVPEPWASMYDPKEMPDLGYREGENDGKPAFYENMVRNENFGLDLGTKNWHCVRGEKMMSEEERRRMTAVYYGMMSLLDREVGRILDHLEKSGRLADTTVVFTSDHGDYLGNHGMWWKGLPAYEDSQRIPFIVRDPECRTPGTHSRAYQSSIDILPGFLGSASLGLPALTQGIDQSEVWRDSSKTARDWALCEFRPTEHAFMQKTFWQDDLKMVLYTDPSWGELYDLSRDPDQRTNLWSAPEARERKDRMLLAFVRAEMEKDGTLRPRTAMA